MTTLLYSIFGFTLGVFIVWLSTRKQLNYERENRVTAQVDSAKAIERANTAVEEAVRLRESNEQLKKIVKLRNRISRQSRVIRLEIRLSTNSDHPDHTQ